MANTYSLDLEAGSSQYAYIADASQTGLDLATTFTIEAWVKAEDQPSTNAYTVLVAKTNGSNQQSYGWLYRDVSGTKYVDAFVFNGADYDQYRWAVTLTSGVWFHLAVTCNVGNASATTFELFVNGVSQGNGTAVGSNNISSITDSTASFAIGARMAATPDKFFDGLIDEVRVWNDVRSEAEIDANMYSQLVGNEANLVGYWKFNNNYLDETANNNDLTSSGSPVFSTIVPFVGEEEESGTNSYKSLLGVGL